jgi:hypothetical protein
LKPPNKAKATRNWECMAVVVEWLLSDMLGRKDKMELKYYVKRTRSRRQASHANRNGMK